MKKIEPLKLFEETVKKEPNIIEKALSLVFGEGKFQVAQGISHVQTREEDTWIGAYEEPGFVGGNEEWFDDSGFEIPTDEGIFGGRKWDDESVAW